MSRAAPRRRARELALQGLYQRQVGGGEPAAIQAHFAEQPGYAQADRTFLDAARRHLIAHWRYQPAAEDGRTIASSIVITLRFELNG